MGLILLLFAVVPQEAPLRDAVDLVELNHFYDEHGRLVFDQLIFYDWDEGDRRYHVRAWRLLKQRYQIPQRDWVTGGYFSMWIDGEAIRHVHTKHTRETWGQFDPELVERDYLPKEQRKELQQSNWRRLRASLKSAGAAVPAETPRAGSAP
jgi:hypothetical protein